MNAVLRSPRATPPPIDPHAVSPGRLCAHRVLRRSLAEGAYADRAFRAEAEAAALDPRERAFAQQLAYGALQRLTTLDHVLAELSSRPLGRIDAPLRDTLRLGIFQVAYMDGVADHAAVAQTVELAKTHSPRSHGFANAVMRRAAREATGLIDGLGEATPAEAALRHSHPEWLVRSWWDALGAGETRRLLTRDNEPAESAVRANTLRTSPAAVAAALADLSVTSRPADLVPEGLVLETPFDVHGSELFAAGALMPQSRASMLVARIADPRPGEQILDLCAAPGAKTTHLAALAGGAARIVAVERDPGRAQALVANCGRLGAAGVEVRCADAAEPPSVTFDRVLLDPPCSDLGTLQARPDVRWHKRPEQVAALAATQAELLDAAAVAVRVGGTLIYSTCTISREENEWQMLRFLSEHPDFSADPLGDAHPSLASAEDRRFLQLLPHRDLTDGFFIARLRRDGAG